MGTSLCLALILCVSLSSCQETFDKAASDVMVLLQTPTHKEAGELYGLYKQVKVGDINVGEFQLISLKKKKL